MEKSRQEGSGEGPRSRCGLRQDAGERAGAGGEGTSSQVTGARLCM